MSLSHVRNHPSVYVNRGEGELLGKVLYFVSAATGQVEVAVTPSGPNSLSGRGLFLRPLC